MEVLRPRLCEGKVIELLLSFSLRLTDFCLHRLAAKRLRPGLCWTRYMNLFKPVLMQTESYWLQELATPRQNVSGLQVAFFKVFEPENLSSRVFYFRNTQLRRQKTPVKFRYLSSQIVLFSSFCDGLKVALSIPSASVDFVKVQLATKLNLIKL